MKLSLAWIFDHIETPWRKDDVAALVNLFNQKTAEIEAFYPITCDKKNLFLGQITHIGQEVVELYIPELKQTIELPKRADAQLQQWFLIKRKENRWRYATGKDLHSDIVTELPPVYADDKSASGTWKDMIQEDDYILEVDNKSITHRPDLWSHRGFAREVAILLDLPLKKIENIIAPLPVAIL